MTDQGRLRVLYVEDNDFTRGEVVRQLRAVDPLLDVRAVGGASSAAQALRDGFSPDVALVDLRLEESSPRLGGLALHAILGGVPVVLLTAERSPPEGVLRRCAAYLLKGVSPALLARTVRAAKEGFADLKGQRGHLQERPDPHAHAVKCARCENRFQPGEVVGRDRGRWVHHPACSPRAE